MEPADIPLTIRFDETFRKDANELEDEAFRYEGSKVPLNQLALTLMMLNLPMADFRIAAHRTQPVRLRPNRETARFAAQRDLPVHRFAGKQPG